MSCKCKAKQPYLDTMTARVDELETSASSQEVAARPEIVLGEYVTRHIPVEHLIMLSQVRGGKNPESEKLKASIEANGMINPIDVACMTHDDLERYIGFVNRVWGSNLLIDDYNARMLDGAYYLVVAGHSRTIAVVDIARDNPQSQYILNCKIHPISSPEDIINLQLEENIHSKPSLERQAMAIIEAYQWGLEVGRWRSKQEFIRLQRGSVKPKQLDDALGFASLPEGMRRFVFGKHIPYAAALELGRQSDTMVRYEKQRLKYDELPEIVGQKDDGQPITRDDALAEVLWHRINELVMHISKHQLNSTAAKKYIEGQAAVWHKALDDDNDTTREAAMLELSWATPAEEANQYIRDRRAAFEAMLRQISTLPVEQAKELVRLSGVLVGIDTAYADQILDETARRAREMLGSGVLAATIIQQHTLEALVS